MHQLIISPKQDTIAILIKISKIIFPTVISVQVAAAMTGSSKNPAKMNTKSRVLSNTEYSWCRTVSSGTGNTVLALQVARSASEITTLRTKLHDLQTSHPLLRSKLCYHPAAKEFSFLTPDTPQVEIDFHDSSSTSQILKTLKTAQNSDATPLQLILEHELNRNKWVDPDTFPCRGIDVFFTTVYMLSEAKAVIVIKLHAAVCDRTTAESLLREMMEGGASEEGSTGIENLVPKRMAKKTLWAHGVSMFRYSVNSLRSTNLEFIDAKKPRFTEVVRLHMNAGDTARILQGCKSREIKLFGALAAAGLISVHSTKLDEFGTLNKKYGVVTLTDCRPDLEPPLSTHHFGFYHSVILNLHTLKGDEDFWDLAQRIYLNYADYKKCNRHLSDMSDINYLMCKAVENPSLTASSSLRTSCISVFEDPVFDESAKLKHELGVERYLGCASAHGVGPSIAIFDTVRDGELDCVCVYPAPLHSRAQMNGLVERMRRVMIEKSRIKKSFNV